MESKTSQINNKPTPLAKLLLQRRYLRKNKCGEVIETPDELCKRVAGAVAAAELVWGGEPAARLWREEFYKLMASCSFMPSSPILINAGRDDGTLSACVVLPIPDSIEGIFSTIKDAAMIHKAGGGTGFSFDRLRPTGDIVGSSGGRSSGPISFMRVFSEATNAIQQGALGHGANMAMMSVDHPDILQFITAKAIPGALENFNLTVKVTDAFMEFLKAYPLSPHIVTNPRTGRKCAIPKKVDPRRYTFQDLILAGQEGVPCYSMKDIWDLIITNAHSTGEPGLCFIDHVNWENPTRGLGQIEATNPCGGQPLLPYESCALGSINLAAFVDSANKTLKFELLAEAVRTAVRFLDDVIDVNHYPIEEIRAQTLANRKIGLGIMGFADALIMLGIRYENDRAVEFAEEIAEIFTHQAHEASQELAAKRGNFPNWESSRWCEDHKKPMRNACVTAIAPTGSISIIAGCSSGVKPISDRVTRRCVLDGEETRELYPLVEKIGIEQGWLTQEVRKALLAGHDPREINDIPKQAAELFATAHEISPGDHLRIQAAFEWHTDNTGSQTVNLPETSTVKDVNHILQWAYELGCGGIRVYRDESQKGQALSVAGRMPPAIQVGAPARSITSIGPPADPSGNWLLCV